MKETTVARSSLAPTLIFVGLAYAFFIVILLVVPGILSWLLIAGATWIAYRFIRRVASMRLAVNNESVIVVNFTTQHRLDLNTVQVDSRLDHLAWPQDDLLPDVRDALGDGEQKPAARALWLTDASGEEVRVGVAPVYGSRLDDLAEDLIDAIEVHRSAA